MTDNHVEIGGRDITATLRLIATGVPTGIEVEGPGDTKLALRTAPGVNAVVKQLRLDNPELNNEKARSLAGVIRDIGFHHPTVAQFRLEQLFVDGAECPVCAVDWNSKLEKNLLLEKKVTSDVLVVNLGDGAESGAHLLGKPLLVSCRECGLRCRTIHFVHAMIPDPDGKGASVTVVVLNAFIPMVPRSLVPKMKALWEQTGGVVALYRMRTSEMFEQWAKDEPEEAARWGFGAPSGKAKLYDARGNLVEA
jgi:hypothetical protein